MDFPLFQWLSVPPAITGALFRDMAETDLVDLPLGRVWNGIRHAAG